MAAPRVRRAPVPFGGARWRENGRCVSKTSKPQTQSLHIHTRNESLCLRQQQSKGGSWSSSYIYFCGRFCAWTAGSGPQISTLPVSNGDVIVGTQSFYISSRDCSGFSLLGDSKDGLWSSSYKCFTLKTRLTLKLFSVKRQGTARSKGCPATLAGTSSFPEPCFISEQQVFALMVTFFMGE